MLWCILYASKLPSLLYLAGFPTFTDAPLCFVFFAGARERIIVGTQYAEVPLGVHIIRGENVVLFGEVDEAREPPAGLQLVSESEIKMAQRAEKEADKMKGMIRSRFDFLDGMD